MKGEKKKLLFGLTVGISCLVLGICALAASLSVQVHQRMTTGRVHIALTEYVENAAGELVEGSVEAKNLYPGQLIVLKPVVKNLGQDCYLRIRSNLQQPLSDHPLTWDDFIGLEKEKWEIRNLTDGNVCFYYKQVLKSEQEATLFEKVKIPDNWDQTFAGKKMDLNLTAQAVQSSSFSQDLQALEPWEQLEIETYRETEDLEKRGEVTSGITVLYSESAKRLLVTAENQQNQINLEDWMPGETKQFSLSLKNSSKESIPLYFSTASMEQYELAGHLKVRIDLKTQQQNKTFYEGMLGDARLQKMQLLGRLAAGESQEMEVTLLMPEELTNQYANQEINGIFYFGTDRMETPETEWESGQNGSYESGTTTGNQTGIPGSTGSLNTGTYTGSSGYQETTPSKEEQKGDSYVPVQTSDESRLLLFAGILLAATGVLLIRKVKSD